MYEYFYGTIKEIYSSYVVLEVNDIAYQIFLIRNSELSINSKIKIYIYNFVSDSLNALFGFYTPLEKNIFANLLKVKNIGVKSAYVILNKVNVDLLLTAIYQDNDEFLLKLPKVNKNNIDNLKKSLRKEAERNVYQIKNAGGNIELIPLKGSYHGITKPVYNETDAIEWMIRQTR